jgi:hypothetical protein
MRNASSVTTEGCTKHEKGKTRALGRTRLLRWGRPTSRWRDSGRGGGAGRKSEGCGSRCSAPRAAARTGLASQPRAPRAAQGVCARITNLTCPFRASSCALSCRSARRASSASMRRVAALLSLNSAQRCGVRRRQDGRQLHAHTPALDCYGRLSRFQQYHRIVAR